MDNKASAFIDRLLANPTMHGLTPLQQEEQILQFLKVNAARLMPTLQSPAFYPNRYPEDIFRIMVSALYEKTNDKLKDQLRTIIRTGIDYKFIGFLRQQHASADQVKAQIEQFMMATLGKPDARQTLTGAQTALSTKISNRYLEAVADRGKYIHFELTKVQRLRMSPDDIKNLVLVSILLRSAIYRHSEGTGGEGTSSVVVTRQYADKVFKQIRGELNLLPDQVIKSAIHSNLSFVENPFIEATSRLAAVFSLRCHHYRPNQKIDRGAESSDKSWLNIARKNYKFYGLDLKMLDELYNIAAENNW